MSLPKKSYLPRTSLRALENYGIVILIMALMIGASGLAGKLRLSLVGQGLTLPWVVSRFSKPNVQL
jgi:hypothetical protein